MINKRLFRFAAALISLCVSVLACEYITREYCDFSAVTELHFKGYLVDSKDAYFKLSKNKILYFELKKPAFDESSFRHPGTFRIIVLGDSSTYRGGPIGNYYPYMLQDALNDDHPGKGFEVMNAGVIGYNLIQETEYLRERLTGYFPDLVIVGYSPFNDRTVRQKSVKYKEGSRCCDVVETYPYILELPFNKYLLSHSALYRFINIVLVNVSRRSGSPLLTGKIKYFDLTFETEKSLERLKQLSLNNKFKLLVVVIPVADKTFDISHIQYERNWINEKCKALSIDILDLSDIFEKYSFKDLLILPEDRLHFNKFGHQLVSREIREYLEKNRKLPGR